MEATDALGRLPCCRCCYPPPLVRGCRRGGVSGVEAEAETVVATGEEKAKGSARDLSLLSRSDYSPTTLVFLHHTFEGVVGIFSLSLVVLFYHRTEWGSGEGGGEELRLPSQKVQELSEPVPERQLILRMNCEDQTVYYTNMFMAFLLRFGKRTSA